MPKIEPDYPIRTSRLLLRPFEDVDLASLHDLYSRPDVVRYLYTDGGTLEEMRAVLEKRIGQRVLSCEGERLTLAIVPQTSGIAVGEVTLVWRSELHRQGEIGFVLHPDEQGKGYAAEAASELLSLGFDELGLHRVYGRCDARNGSSAKLMERLGMRREAHFVHNELFKGEWGEEYVYAMLDHEWRAVRDRVTQGGLNGTPPALAD